MRELGAFCTDIIFIAHILQEREAVVYMYIIRVLGKSDFVNTLENVSFGDRENLHNLNTADSLVGRSLSLVMRIYESGTS